MPPNGGAATAFLADISLGISHLVPWKVLLLRLDTVNLTRITAIKSDPAANGIYQKYASMRPGLQLVSGVQLRATIPRQTRATAGAHR